MKEFNNEIVFRGHPDKLADQISDRILMEYLKEDMQSVVNVDVVGGEGTVFVTGEVSSPSHIDIQEVVKDVLADVGYTQDVMIINEVKLSGSCSVEDVEVNSEEVEIIYGYACNETPNLLPKGMVILQELAEEYDKLCKSDGRFLADGKAIMNGLYDEDGKLVKIKSININHQNTGTDPESTNEKMYGILSSISNKHGVAIEDYKINPYGSYLIGGFDRDTGLTGRKSTMDSYQGFAPTNRVTLSGKNPGSKARAGVYKAREIAKQTLLDNNLEWCQVQISYIKGNQKPTLIEIDSNIGPIALPTNIYEECISSNIVKDLDILNKDLMRLSAYGHCQS